MKYTPLPWIHLASAIRPSETPIRLVLDQFPRRNTRCMASLFVGSSDQPLSDLSKVLNSKLPLSARQKACLDLLFKSENYSTIRDKFYLSPWHICELFQFVGDIVIEIKSMGAIALSSHLATIKAELQQTEEGHALNFVAKDSTGHILKSPEVLGNNQTFLLDRQLRLFLVDPPLHPSESLALLDSAPLPIEGLWQEEAFQTFDAIASQGVDLSCLCQLSVPPSKTPQIFLRALLKSDGNGSDVSLRLHLVSELSFDEVTDEVEIPSRGSMPPVLPLAIDAEKAKGKERPVHLVQRPTDKEEEAREILFKIGANAASTHRGFIARSQNALNVLAHIAEADNLPEWLNVDRDLLPNIIRLPNTPVLNIAQQGDNWDQLVAHMDFGEQTRNIDIKFEQLVSAMEGDASALLAGEDTIMTFSPASKDTLKFVSEALELKDLRSRKPLSLVEAALIYRSICNSVEFTCSDALMQRLTSFTAGPIAKDRLLPSCVKTALRPYQHDALTWMSQLDRVGLGRLLADDMGLGKTLMVLSLLAKKKEEEGPKTSLVVAPTSVIDVWINEAKKHLADFSVYRWHGADRADRFEEIKNADLVVTSYALLRRDINDFLTKLHFRYLILDEAQNVKNPRTESWKSAGQIKADQKLALTGTPIENRVDDLWSILDLVAPGALGTERAFARRYSSPIAKGNIERLNELRQRVHPIILRRKKGDVENDLPPRIENILRCEMAPDQRALYFKILQSMKNEFGELLKRGATNRERISLLAALTRLRQTCCDPRIIAGGLNDSVSSAKAELFSEVVKECLSMGRRIIVYSQFVKMQRIIHELLEKAGVKDALWLHGGTKNRGDIIETFQSPSGPPVIVVSLKAGGTGVTLTAADTVIYYDPWWNPAVEDQAADRAHRIGQTKTVHLIKLICENSIEEQIVALAQRKRQSAENILTTDKAGPRSLTMEEISRLLQIELDRAEL